ncbi:HD domain-containing protein ['Camptotheca acuminata' phytoplasma]|uniref:HD domain-containing protein n=1 Tax='Camptotheca acuminata' phytoplasma TaxID=3239192 RepID=UPI00351A8750
MVVNLKENKKKEKSFREPEKFKKKEVFTDPIYGSIFLDYVYLEKLIDTASMRRLRNIKQLSAAYIVFNGAEHSRFNHSLGVYELARKFLELNPNIFDIREKLVLLTATLLHDIGHPPFSHLCEKVFQIQHEQKSFQIIKEDPEISWILDSIDPNFKNDVAFIIYEKGENKKLYNEETKKRRIHFKLIRKLLSSQLDFDRLDYLKRDSFFAGVSYGYIDYNYLIRSIVVDKKQNEIVFRKSSLPSIDNYLINRFHMYFTVYNNKKVLGYSVILEKIFIRLNELLDNKYIFKSKTFEVENDNILFVYKKCRETKFQDITFYQQMDDIYINSLIVFFQKQKDEEPILVNLCNDFFNRNIWLHSEDFNLDSLEEIQKKYNFTEEESKYYIYDYNNQKEIFIYKEDTKMKKSQDEIFIYTSSQEEEFISLKENKMSILKELNYSNVRQYKYFFRKSQK